MRIRAFIRGGGASTNFLLAAVVFVILHRRCCHYVACYSVACRLLLLAICCRLCIHGVYMSVAGVSMLVFLFFKQPCGDSICFGMCFISI